MPVAYVAGCCPVARKNAVSSTPIAVGASIRAGSSMIGWPRVMMIRMIVAQPTPSADATRDTAPSRAPTCSNAHARARSVRHARGSIAGLLLGPGLLGAPRMWATPDSFVPAHHHRSAADRQVAYPYRTAILRPCHRAAVGARYNPSDGFDQQFQLTAGIRGGQHAEPVQPEQRSNNRTGNLCFHLGLLDSPCDLGRDHGSCEPPAHDQLISEPEACRPVSPLPGS